MMIWNAGTMASSLRTCEDIYMFKEDPPESSIIQLWPDGMKSYPEVDCKYLDKNVCQATMITETKRTSKWFINDKTVNKYKDKPFFRQLTFEDKSKFNNTITILRIEFKEEVVLRGLSTVWDVLSLDYKPSDGQLKNLKVKNESWTLKYGENRPLLPNGIQSFPRPIFAVEISLELDLGMGQFSPYLELRGCYVDGKKFWSCFWSHS